MSKKVAVNGRVTPEIKQKISQVAEEEGVTVSEIVRRGMTAYVTENPDRYPILGETDFVGQMMEALES